jgi:hypothetical protein
VRGNGGEKGISAIHTPHFRIDDWEPYYSLFLHLKAVITEYYAVF